jgi:ubiquinone/menaquinone biosynthesis C-methylase UbiE
VWADLGAGSGAFTLALAELLGAGATIHAVDRDRGALSALSAAMHSQFAATTLTTHVADFTQPLDMPPLDGIVMANSLHFVRDKQPVIASLRTLLKTEGRLIVVEYDSDKGNQWVPYPFTYPMWQRLASEAGFAHSTLLATHPSSWMRQFYSAASWGVSGKR